MSEMSEIQQLEMDIFEKTRKLAQLKGAAPASEVPDYQFRCESGEVSLSDLFAGRDTLFMIHNMGQGCRYCTLWGDGLNGFLPHLEDRFAVVMVSRDPPELQRRFANARGWRFRLASHGGGDYIREQSVMPDSANMPGIVCYQRDGSRILRKNSGVFGPWDLYCSIWNVLALAGETDESWTPQYNYWQRPAKLDDGGADVR